MLNYALSKYTYAFFCKRKSRITKIDMNMLRASALKVTEFQQLKINTFEYFCIHSQQYLS